MYISTNKDVFIYQGTGGGSEANQEMFFVPPISCGSRGDVNNIPFIEEIGTKIFNGAVSIVSRKDDNVEVNGTALTSQPSGITVQGPFDVPNKTEYVTYRVEGLSGNVSVTSSGELYVAYFTENQSATSGAFYSGFATNPRLDLDLTASKLGSCISESGTSNIVLNVSNDGNFDSVEWQKQNSDDSWSAVSGATNTQFTPSEVGVYRVKGIINCDSETVEYFSASIPISTCPTDFDNDGIIDNIDLDLDNDGILNSVESKGIGNIDFTVPGNPTVTLSDGTVFESLINGYIGSGSTSQGLSGQNNSFELKVEAGVDENLEYELIFIESLNINIKDNPNVATAIKEGESFIIKSSPASSNITLLDPNNNLLVDTDYDPDTENVTINEFTSNIIRFKFNPNSAQNLDYEFFATNINGITFKTEYSTTDTTGESVFVPNVYVFDYLNDSDNDLSTAGWTGQDIYEIDSDNDGCNDIIEADFVNVENFQGDPDSDGVYGQGDQTFDNGNVDERGRIKIHNDANGYGTDPKKDNNGNYLFQTVGSAVQILSQPLSTAACEGATVDFNITTSSESGEIKYQWQFYDSVSGVWNDLNDSASYSGTETERLTISSITSSMNGQYRVVVNSEFYLCDTESDDNVTLSVNLSPANPVVSQIQTFCQTDTPKISDLTTSNMGSNTLLWYSSVDSTDPLDPDTELQHNTFYYAEYIDTEGCVSASRTESKAFLSNPILTSTDQAVCLGDSTTLTIENIAKTAADFAAENDLIFITNNGDPVTWPTQYGETYFMIQAGTNQSGFSPIDWPDAKALTDNYNSGDSNASARMYVILNADMEKAVHDGLSSMGLTGNNGVAFWLGLYQAGADRDGDGEPDEVEPDYIEPGNESQNWGGWKWVNGTYLKDSGYTNWYDNEPNNAGDEHHGQFEFSANGIQWNDMSVGNTFGQSWPLFEYSGSTDIVWGYYDDNGNEILFEEQPGTGNLIVTPEKVTTYFVKVTVNGIECYAETTVNVNPNPNINEIPDYVFCDDDSDGDPNNGSISINADIFNVLKSSILGDTQQEADFDVSFFRNSENAESGVDPIEFPYTTPTKDSSALHWESISTEIFVRVTNKATGCISSGKTFNLVVNTLPIVFEVDDLFLCDDDYDGIVEGFNLESRTNELRSGNDLTDPNDLDNQSSANFPITYHLNLEEANDLNNPGITSPFESSNATIFYRIKKLTNDGDLVCYKTGEAFRLVVDPLPIVKTEFVNIEQCDDGRGSDNDGITLHDLTDTESLFSDNYELETFKYYTDFNLTQEIEDPTAYLNVAFNDIVYLKIISQDGCEINSKTPGGADRLLINITVGASEISENFIEENNTIFSVCDDSDPLSQDGISVFSSDVLKEINQKVINSNPKFDDQRIKVTLHTNSNDGLTGNNPIDINSDFTTISPNTQEIWARVVNVDITEFTCLGYEKVGILYVEPRPIANPVTIDRQCDGDSPLDLDSQDGLYPFDVSLIEDQVINGQTGVTVTYFNEDGTQIENFSPTFSTASQTITIRVERDPSYPNITNPDGLCYDETTLEFIVDDSPEIFPITIAAQCDGDDGGDDTDGYDIFDTSNVLSKLITNPETGISQDASKLNIQFTYIDENGNTITSTELPNPFNTKTQSVIVTVENPLNINCIVTDEIDFIVNPLPTFTVDDDTIVCLNLPPIPIGVSSAEAEYSYAWEHEDLNGNRSPFPSSGSTIFIGVGGTYFVTATTTDGTNCSRTLSIDVEESIIATVTLDDITVEDLTSDNNNTITIDPTNLGIGDYEYAIDDPNGPYQNEPFFDGVRPGIHTIYIRDKNDCGIAQIDVSVIGYKKFFTPNGDGIHDTWRILGIRQDFQPNSKVYIFNRYGKLLKDLDPVSVGWDGTFIGRPMPQTDYWFRVFLEDGREFKGHFSLIRGK